MTLRRLTPHIRQVLIRERPRYMHCSQNIGQNYGFWSRRCIGRHVRNRKDMCGKEVDATLTMPANERKGWRFTHQAFVLTE